MIDQSSKIQSQNYPSKNQQKGISENNEENDDPLNLSIFSDMDIEQIQDGFLTDMQTQAEQLVPNNNIDLNPEEEKLIQSIREENQLLLYERNKKLFTNMTHLPPNKIVLKPKSCYQSFRKAMIDFFYFFVPFRRDFNYLTLQGNRSLIILFQVIRMMYIASILSLFIFLYLVINHFMTNSSTLNTFCKLSFPCVTLYSSHTSAEFETYSITIGTWIVFIFFCGMIYFFITLTEEQENKMFIRKESIVSQYVFTSWNFNVKDLTDAKNSKTDIVEKCKDYLSEEISRLKIKTQKTGCHYNCCCRFITRFLSWLIFAVILLGETFLLLFTLFLRNLLKNKTAGKQKMELMDIIPEIIFYLLIPIFLILLPFVCSFLPRMELFPNPAIRNKHVIIKYFLAHVWGLISFIGIQVLFTYKGTTMKALLNFEFPGLDTFGCPGNFTVEADLTNKPNYPKFIPQNTYSRCREDDVGINFLFVSIGYFVTFIAKDLFEYICCCCCHKMVFQPYENMVAIFTMITLFSITVPFMPIFIGLIPIVLFIIFKFEIFKIKKLAKNNYNIYNSINQKNKALEMLFTFLFCLFELMAACLFFYLHKFPHFFFSECVSNDDVYAMFFSTTNFCGPAPTLFSSASSQTAKITTTIVVGDLYSCFSEPSMLIIIFTALISALVYWRFNEATFRNFTIKRQNEMVNSLHLTLDHLIKRDVVTSILLKVFKKKNEINHP